ncbi:hypothetical protein E1263_00455 [Kribbella antibiotica]|uniref:Uncharacterized protein n=1 Tax=Kribbella antibiotica TaxID=190195 RepID=A0A4V2YQW3_9ACTN|nr:hypothetical protein [Kribbella antibiotica]TDD63457.1 hypothetical protein E1263_00455 [Kribbella antibiotica]
MRRWSRRCAGHWRSISSGRLLNIWATPSIKLTFADEVTTAKTTLATSGRLSAQARRAGQ